MTPQIFNIVVAALLLAAAFWDCKWGKIPNWLVGVIVAVYAAQVALVGPFVWGQIILAVCVFAAGLVLFAIGAFGAGAVKLMSATALFIPLDGLGWLALCLVAGIIAGLPLFGALRGTFGSDNSSWSVLTKRVIPLAVPIGITGLVGLFVIS